MSERLGDEEDERSGEELEQRPEVVPARGGSRMIEGAAEVQQAEEGTGKQRPEVRRRWRSGRREKMRRAGSNLQGRGSAWRAERSEGQPHCPSSPLHELYEPLRKVKWSVSR